MVGLTARTAGKYGRHRSRGLQLLRREKIRGCETTRGRNRTAGVRAKEMPGAERKQHSNKKYAITVQPTLAGIAWQMDGRGP